MLEEEAQRLNFYSKYNRVKGRQEIDTLYNLIHNNKPSEIHIVNLSMLRQERQKRTESELKRKISRPIIPSNLLGKENDSEDEQELEEMNEKLEKLKRLERQFHKEMDRREREVKKKKQLKEQQRISQQQHRDQHINVVDLKSSHPSSLKSSELKSKKNDPVMQQVDVDNVELDFQDYYRDVPEVPIAKSYLSSTPNKKMIHEIMQNQKNKQKFVESVDEEGDRKTVSIVIGRINLENKTKIQNQEQIQEPKKLIEIELTHSQSLNVFPGNRLYKKQTLEEQKDILIRKASDQYHQSNVEDYSPARHLQSIEDNFCFPSIDQQKEEPIIQNQDSSQIEEKNVQKQEFDSYQPSQKAEENEKDYPQCYPNDGESNPPSINLANNTGTEQGESMKEEIEDRVDPMMNKSQFRQQTYNTAIQASVFHSQTLPNSKVQIPREVQSITSNSLDYHPLEPPGDDGTATETKLQNKRSSFKRLMAETRSNLVPRMAISTILNEHINEALVDFRPIAQPARSPLHQSIISSESPTPLSPPSKTRRVNFKQKIVEQQLDKSYSRESRPSFDRDNKKVQKNRGLLLNFFAEN